jgi:hypothetical protein
MDNQLIFWYRHTTDSTKTHETNRPKRPGHLRMPGLVCGVGPECGVGKREV